MVAGVYFAGLVIGSAVTWGFLPSCGWSGELARLLSRPQTLVASIFVLLVSIGLPLFLAISVWGHVPEGAGRLSVAYIASAGSAWGAITIPAQILRFSVSEVSPRCQAGAEPIFISTLYLVGFAMIIATLIVGVSIFARRLRR